MLDATYVPKNIAFPQEINLLNEGRENLEAIIDHICNAYNESKPRTYRRNARKAYLSVARAKRESEKRSVKQSRNNFSTSDGI